MPYKTSFSSTSDAQAGSSSEGLPVPPAFRRHYLLWAICDRALIWDFFSMLFLCGISSTCPWRPFGARTVFARHPCGAGGLRFVASRPLSPTRHRDGLCDGTWMSPGVILGLRNNGRALCLLPSLTPFPCLSCGCSFVSSNSPHVLWTSRGGEGTLSKITYFVPTTEPRHCPLSSPPRPADGILMKRDSHETGDTREETRSGAF